MLDTISQGLALFVEYGVPVLPYFGTSFAVYYIMNLFVKPIIRLLRHKDGTYSGIGKVLKLGYWVYPLALGSLTSMLFPHLISGYCVLAALCSQVWYYVLYAAKSYARKKGISVPPDSQDVISPKD